MKIRTVVIALFSLVVSTVAVKADSQQGQQACMSDAMTVCGQFIPDRERVAACLLSNRTRISAACRAALAHFNPWTAAR
jgi:hypothetical protein